MTDAIGNRTIGPREPAEAAETLEITEVISFRSGEFLDSRKLIQHHKYGGIVKTRERLRISNKRQRPLLGCGICSVPVHLAANPLKRFFFRHQQEDGSCPAVTLGSLSMEEIQARKYHGQRESNLHKSTKELILRSLRADPRAANLVAEQTWRSAGRPSEFRRPDVRVLYQFLGHQARIPVAIEAQLSTTFLGVVVGRKEFYRRENSLLFWIVRHFDPNYRRMMEDDLLFNNNSNIFSIDEYTMARSEESEQFLLRCNFRRPYRVGDQLEDKWESEIVPFSELAVNLEKQQAFFFDFESCEKQLRSEIMAEGERRQHQIEQERKLQRVAKSRELRHEFISYVICLQLGAPAALVESDSAWYGFCRRFKDFDVVLTPAMKLDREFICGVLSLESVKEKKVVGYDFERLIQVAHNLFDHHKGLLPIFRLAIDLYSCRETIESQDRSRRWRRKIMQLVSAPNSIQMIVHKYREIFSFLFPELYNLSANVDGQDIKS